MFVHFLSQEFQQYVSIARTELAVAGRPPNLDATFDVCGALGDSLRPGHLRSGALVTLLASDGNMLRPQTQATGTRRVFHDTNFIGNAKFAIFRVGGSFNSVIRTNHTVAIAVPVPGRVPLRWVTIDGDGLLRVGPASRNLPATAARFTLQTVPEKIAIKPHDNNPSCAFGPALTAPLEGTGQLGYDVVLDRDAPAPAGSRVTVSFATAVAGARLSTQGASFGAPSSTDPITVVVPPGSTKASFFVIGLNRPNVCRIFNDFAAAATRQPPTVHGSVEARTTAIDGFRYLNDGSEVQHDRAGTDFTGVATFEPIAITIDGAPLKNRLDFDDPVERYGVSRSARGQPDGLKIQVASQNRNRFRANAQFQLVMTAQYINRSDFPVAPDSVPPGFVAPGGTRVFRSSAQGEFLQDFQLRGYRVSQAQMLCVNFALLEIGTPKAWVGQFAVQVSP